MSGRMRIFLLMVLLVLVVQSTSGQEKKDVPKQKLTDPVLQLDVVHVGAFETSPLEVTGLHRRFTDSAARNTMPYGTVLLDTLRGESVVPFRPFAQLEPPSVKQLLAELERAERTTPTTN